MKFSPTGWISDIAIAEVKPGLKLKPDFSISLERIEIIVELPTKPLKPILVWVFADMAHIVSVSKSRYFFIYKVY